MGKSKILLRRGLWTAVLAAAGCTAQIPGDGYTGSGGGAVTGVGGNGGAVVPRGTGGGGGQGPVGTGGYGVNAGSGGDAGYTGPLSSVAAIRKVKNVLTGLGPTDAELAQGTTPDGLKKLIDGWMGTATQPTPEFQSKMILFFANTFQQSSLSVLDFEFQLRKRPGAFDLPYAIFGENAFPMLFRNMKESFARTCLELIAEGRPFTEVLTTTRFMMTTALKSLYLQIEMPYDIHTMTFSVNQDFSSVRPVSMQSEIDALTFNYAKPTTVTAGRNFGDQTANCAGKVSSFPGNTNLFQVLLGVVPRDAPCMEHAIKPYFSDSDLNDWQMVTVSSGTPLRSYDLPAIRASGGTLLSQVPRVSFFTTPAFFAVWNTNDSNQHRVTANQALLAALGEGFTSADQNFPTPPSSVGLNGTHAVNGSVCYGCHKSLDPMRSFWDSYYDYNEKPKGTTTSRTPGGSFGFANVQANGTTLVDFGTLLGQVVDEQVAGQPVNRFALAMTQKLCFFANSSACDYTDAEMRRVALAFQNASFDFRTLVRELMSSPLVTAAAPTDTTTRNGVTISVARRDQLCAALSNRLGKPDICETEMPTPTDATTAMNRLVGAISADAFSRGSENPVTPTDPNLFYRAASELACEAIAAKVVDATTGTVYQSSNASAAITDMVVKVMGVPATDPHYADALKALNDHYTAAMTTGKATATNALRSTFSAACQSPTALSFGI